MLVKLLNMDIIIVQYCEHFSSLSASFFLL